MPRMPEAHPAATLLIHGGALGDLVLTLQTLIRAGLASNGVIALSRVDPGGLHDAAPPIQRQSPESLALHRLHMAGGAPSPALAALLRGRCVVNALGDPLAPVHDRLAAAAPSRLLSFDPRERPGPAQHITDQWLSDLGTQGLGAVASQSQAAESHVRPSQAMVARGRAALDDRLPNRHRGRVCALIPGSGGRPKCWPLPNYLALARDLARTGVAPMFLLGPTELEQWSQGELSQVRAAAPCLEAPHPRTLAETLAAADVVVGNDSGPTHLAALLGRAVVAIFGPTSPVVWRPLGSRVRVIAGRPRASAADWGVATRVVLDAIAAGDAAVPD